MLEYAASNKERNGHQRPMNIVFIGGDETSQKRALRSIHLRWRLASMTSAATGAAGLMMVREALPDLVIVHTDLRDMFPQVLVEELGRISRAPVMVLSREMDETEATTALDLGADDYLQFPCGMWQLAARVWAVLRRSGYLSLRDETRCFLMSGRLLIDPLGYDVYLDDQKVHLTPSEFRLLYVLAQNHGRVVSHQALENELHGQGGSTSPSAKRHIQRLRWKLEDNAVSPHWIASVYGIGYRFVGPRPRWQEQFYAN